jgi:uncharacterized repeat protein (TIGR01451 family)
MRGKPWARPRRERRGGATLCFALVVTTALGAWFGPGACAQTTTAREQIAGPIDDRRLVTLRGNTRPEAAARNDLGPVPDALPMRHMQMLLTRPPEREAELQAYLQQLQDRASPNYHRWLAAAQFGERYGLAAADLVAITDWLERAGFTVNRIYTSTMVIDFSGTAGDVRRAFHTEIHRLRAHGSRHIANMGDPQIPAALAPAIKGIVSLHDFLPHANYRPRPAYTAGAGYYLVVPADLATIYGFDPLFNAGISGQGQTIVIIEDTNVYATADWTTFRSTFGLSGYTEGSFTQVQPGGGQSCSAPGVTSHEFEAELDAEWASAAAPSAKIELAACASESTFGGLIALENLINGSSVPAIVSISYGECEYYNGTTANAAYDAAFEQAVAEGTSVFVAAGDAGAAACNDNENAATAGVSVSGFASTPYDVAVGGTDFGDQYADSAGSYWSVNNDATFGSALSYVPEIPWNDSCASRLLASFNGYAVTFGAASYCNESSATVSPQYALTTTAGGGGPSNCAIASRGVCTAGYAKPSWQSGLPGNPDDGLRDLPDVALFAADGVWGHYYVVCDSDTSDGNTCSGAPNDWSGGGGTSFATPIMAAIQALINQHAGSAQGNPNPIYYALAAAEYGGSGSVNCNSSKGNTIAANCLFYDVTLGDMDVNCTGSVDCYDPAGTNGVLSTSGGNFAPAYAAATGWDFATGIGSVNAGNLVTAWEESNLSLTGGGALTTGGLLSYTWTITNGGPRTAVAVTLSAALPAGVSFNTSGSSAACSQSGRSLTCSLGAMSVGSSAVVTIVLVPGSTSSVSVEFQVAAGNGVLYPASAAATVVLQTAAVPLPPWAPWLLGLALAQVGLRGVRRRSRDDSDRRVAGRPERLRLP